MGTDIERKDDANRYSRRRRADDIALCDVSRSQYFPKTVVATLVIVLAAIVGVAKYQDRMMIEELTVAQQKYCQAVKSLVIEEADLAMHNGVYPDTKTVSRWQALARGCQ